MGRTGGPYPQRRRGDSILLTQDPIGLAGGVNLYAYAGNNPIAFDDPFGLKVECQTEQACATWDRLRIEAAAALRSEDAKVRTAARALIQTMNRLVQSKHTYFIGTARMSPSDRSVTGGGWTRPERKVDERTEMDLEYYSRRYHSPPTLLLAHELGHADDDMNHGGNDFRAGTTTENYYRSIQSPACTLRENHETPPPCP